MAAPKPHFRAERALQAGGVWPVAGIDEAGRGPLAGPVAAAAVILDPRRLPRGVDDSKRLSAERREDLYEAILAGAVAVSVSFAPADEIDRLNIRMATLGAMRRALAGLAIRPAHALIDGRDVPDGLCAPGRAIIGGDALVLSIAAASIVAKVARDRLMARAAGHFPGYGFERHMGYAVGAHRAALARLGPCALHRTSFAPVRGAASIAAE